MNISEQKLNEVIGNIVSNYSMKGSITTNALCDILEKIDTNAQQMDYVYKSLGEAGIQIVGMNPESKLVEIIEYTLPLEEVYERNLVCIKK